jgi:hypothetical protein
MLEGFTLDKCTINIGKQERQGMTFTTISRVKYLNGLRFEPPFNTNLLSCGLTSTLTFPLFNRPFNPQMMDPS